MTLNSRCMTMCSFIHSVLNWLKRVVVRNKVCVLPDLAMNCAVAVA